VKFMQYLARVVFEAVVLGIILALCIYFVFQHLGLG